ncbi:DUF2993 domain-containing protein [Georgenia satyanarayanai]|uniref:LmeA family phospholipid-binding protein n=1 Tax=Georgenia satyanarayanai TaxID=860221 RepID=UPI002041BDDE|nr:DUF2993 domain-containing protein [Georgenia satyanarayanai]MCM3660448.1 DUF2993 domain-containing protein [Georgenia satyanarayanai]
MRRLASVVLVLLVVLAVAGTVVDRVAVARTEDRLLAEAREQLELAPDADVEIDGFPFLTQVVAGRLSEVRGTASTLVLEDFELHDVRVALRGVAPEEPYPAETVEINAEIPPATLQAALAGAVDVPGAPLRVDVANGLVQLGVEVVAGLELAVVVEPVLVDGAIGVELGEVSVGGGTVPRDLVTVVDDLLGDVRVEIPGLPEGLVPTRLEVGRDAVELRLEGSDVALGEWVG